jgi:hypothetical protein
VAKNDSAIASPTAPRREQPGGPQRIVELRRGVPAAAVEVVHQAGLWPAGEPGHADRVEHHLGGQMVGLEIPLSGIRPSSSTPAAAG